MAPKFSDQDGVVAEPKTRQDVARPRLYKVLMHNDNYTTREFVVHVLRTIFRHDETNATRIMLFVHHQGVGTAGVYPFEIAETKARHTEQLAREQEFPLKLSLEPEEN